jgi:hypothetical protein
MPLTVSQNVFGTLIAFAVIGLLAVLLRWIFGRDSGPGRSTKGFPVPLPVTVEDYGLLCAVAIAHDHRAAASVQARLAAAGIRATLAAGPDGRVRVLVFENQVEAARRLVGTIGDAT